MMGFQTTCLLESDFAFGLENFKVASNPKCCVILGQRITGASTSHPKGTDYPKPHRCPEWTELPGTSMCALFHWDFPTSSGPFRGVKAPPGASL